MNSGFEALPPRSTGRSAKRRRVDSAKEPMNAERDVPATLSEKTEVATALPPSTLADSVDTDAVRETDVLSTGVGDYAESSLYEYLDHTADVQLHSWGDTLGDAMAQNALAMFGYMTEPDSVHIQKDLSRVVEASGHDLISFMFNFLDSCLNEFSTDDFLIKDMKVLSLKEPEAGGSGMYSIRVACFGERFVFGRHPQGTEVKAITYSNMQIITPDGTHTANLPSASDAPVTAVAAVEGEGGSVEAVSTKRRGTFDIYVIVDI